MERPYGSGGRTLKGGLYALAGIVAAILLVGIVASKITVDNQQQMLGVFETRIALQRAFVDVIDQETAIRGYAATHDRRMLEPYFAGRNDIAANFLISKPTAVKRCTPRSQRWSNSMRSGAASSATR